MKMTWTESKGNDEGKKDEASTFYHVQTVNDRACRNDRNMRDVIGLKPQRTNEEEEEEEE